MIVMGPLPNYEYTYLGDGVWRIKYVGKVRNILV